GSIDLGLCRRLHRELVRLGPVVQFLRGLLSDCGRTADTPLEQGRGAGIGTFMNFEHLRAVILDWAGTTVDHGSMAPVAALQRVFAENGVEITPAEARKDMGVLKKDQ